MQLWLLTSELTENDDGNYQEEGHGLFSGLYQAQLFLAKPPFYDFDRTYILAEWQVDNPSYKAPFFYRMVGKYGVWDQVFATGRISNGAASMDTSTQH